MAVEDVEFVEPEKKKESKPWHRPKDYHTYYDSVQCLYKIRLKLDLENLTRYYLLSGGYPGRPWNIDLPEKIKDAVRGRVNMYLRSRNRVMPSYTNWAVLAQVADAFGVPMELLIDEDHYYSRCGFAGYRILCEAHRKGISLEELTYHEMYSDNPKYRCAWNYMWYYTILSYPTVPCSVWGGRMFSRVLMLCNERLGVPIGYLVSRPLHSTRNSSTVYGTLCDTMSALGKRECAFVAAVAKALRDYRTIEALGEEFLVESVDRLLRWYLNGEKEKEEHT